MASFRGHSRRSAAGLRHLPQGKPLQLAGLSLGQLGDEFDCARIFVRRDLTFHVILQSRDEGIVTIEIRRQNHIGLDDHAARFVRGTDDAAFSDRGMREQRGLDLGTGYVVAGRNDHVVCAGNKGKAAFLIAHPELYPLPNAAPTDGLLQNNFQGSQRKFVVNDQGDVKIDYNISDKDRFYGRYSESRFDNPTINSYPLIYNSFATAPTHTGVIDWTRTISPSLVNEVRVGVNYVFNDNGAAANGKRGSDKPRTMRQGHVGPDGVVQIESKSIPLNHLTQEKKWAPQSPDW